MMVNAAGLGDFTSFWADSPLHTPNLDAMAAEGMRFTRAYAGAANCAPSRSALMTGRRLGHAYLRVNQGSISIRDADVTVAEVLKQAGYATGGYGKWGLGVPGSPGAPERQSFDEFVGYYDQVHAHSHFLERLYDSGAALLIPENAGFNEPETGLVPDARVHAQSVIYDRMRSFVKTNSQSGTPFYVWRAWTPPHRKSTLNASEADPGGVYRLYASNPGWDDFDKIQAGFATWVDRQVGDLKQVLSVPYGDDADSVLENTLIIFTSDNGGWHGSHHWDRNVETRNGRTVDLRGAKEGYYEGGLRTPMIVYWKGKIASGGESDLPVAFYDYLPTFAELAGAEGAMPPGVDGASFAATLTGSGVQQREGLYFEGYAYDANAAPTKIARIGDWKMIEFPGGGIELYNLAADPGETVNRVDDPSAAVARQQLLGYILRNHAPLTSHLSVTPPDIGTGSAERNGVMANGVRPPADHRAWRVDGSRDAHAFNGLVRNSGGKAIDLFLDDLHMAYEISMNLERTGVASPPLHVELVGACGFAYCSGQVNAEDLTTGQPQKVQIELRPAVGSPSSDQLAEDLGDSFSLRLSYEGTARAVIVSDVQLSRIRSSLEDRRRARGKQQKRRAWDSNPRRTLKQLIALFAIATADRGRRCKIAPFEGQPVSVIGVF